MQVETIEKAFPRLLRRFQENCNAQGELPLALQMPKNFQDKLNDPSQRKRVAAVLVILCMVDGSPSIIFTRRASKLKEHASEISFPGGHFEDAVDASLEETAVREAEEELEPHKTLLSDFRKSLQVIGPTTPLPSLRGTPVTPFLSVLWKDLNDPVSKYFPGQPEEVDLVFSVTLQELIQNETSHDLPDNRFGLRKAPLFPTPHGEIWGLTAFILRPLLHRLLKPVFVVKLPSESETDSAKLTGQQNHR